MKRIITVTGLAVVLSACSHFDDTDQNSVTQSYENCINEETGEIIDPSYCYGGTDHSTFVYYPMVYNTGQFIEVDKSKKTKPKNAVIVYPKNTTKTLPPYVPATRPVVPAPMPTIQPNKPAAPMPTANQPAKVVPIPKIEANKQPAVKAKR